MNDVAARPSGFPARLNRRSFLIGGALFCASGVAYARQPRLSNPAIEEASFEGLIPSDVGAWKTVSQSGVLLPPPDSLRDRLYDNLVTRIYASPRQPAIMLLLAYNNVQDGVLQVHRPEICYPAGGFVLSDTREMELMAAGRVIPASIFSATSPGRVEQVAYFTRLGDVFPRKWVEQRIAVARANLAGEIPDGMMMRVSVLGLGQNEAEVLLEDFARQFIEQADPRLQRLLIGQTV